jgi:cation diffusion facilitator family transporter
MTDNHFHRQDDNRYAEGRRITWVSVAVNVVLTAMQLVVGFIAHSQSLIADALHTLSDIFADGFVLWANRKSAEAADDEHPYGHGRYETAASLVLGLLLVGTGVGILLAAVDRLQQLSSLPPVGHAALWAALATIAGKELLFRYMLAVAERLRSPMLVANAWHARADALSSVVVAIGIGASLYGFPIADALAAIVVGAMIVKTGAAFAWAALQELIDTGLSHEEVAAIRRTLAQSPGVLSLHDLRTRRMAHQVLVDAHIQVDPRVSVSEGHRIGEIARHGALKAHPEVLDVLVHVDAEDDTAIRGSSLPARDVLVAHLADRLGLGIADLDDVTLHYLKDKVEADIRLAPSLSEDSAQLEQLRGRLAQCNAQDRWFSRVRASRLIAP